ncbi:MAG TPA: hypothetical protein VFA45_24615 [Actinomycetes bacterium]|nr:hypothetical protein [Actinomycetes bacterium]
MGAARLGQPACQHRQLQIGAKCAFERGPLLDGRLLLVQALARVHAQQIVEAVARHPGSVSDRLEQLRIDQTL